ncbi:MAG: sugar phosphate nucleotidyltransferase [Candidatus Zixiibacteriota bacterium]
MKVIIPAAGFGKRLQPHTFSQPKPLLTVADKPIIAHILDPLVKLEPEELILVIGYMADEVEEYIRQNYSIKATFIRQEKLLGLGYAVNLALQRVDNEPVLILLGDTIVGCDFDRFISAGSNVLGLRQVDDPQRFGIAEVEANSIFRVEEKPQNPKTNLALIGLYYLSQSDLLRTKLEENIAAGRTTSGEIQLTDALQAMIQSGAKFTPFEVAAWYDCGKKETLLATNRHLLSLLPAPDPIEGSTIIPPSFIAPDVDIRQCVLGPNVSIASGSRITDSIIKDSIIGQGAVVQDSVLSDSLVGPNVRLIGKCTKVNIGECSEIG